MSDGPLMEDSPWLDFRWGPGWCEAGCHACGAQSVRFDTDAGGVLSEPDQDRICAFMRAHRHCGRREGSC